MIDPVDDELGLDRETLDAWSPETPPADFANRVTAAWQAERAMPSRIARTWMMTAALAAASAFLAFGAVRYARDHREFDGKATAKVRQTVEIGNRAVAVLEPGASLTWRGTRRGETRVEQTTGSVFYRVDHGKKFDVVTPSGNVSVRGTCFRVEVTKMNISRTTKTALASAAAGAVLSAAVIVTVYEGKVVLSNKHGESPVTAGQWSWATASAEPHRATNGTGETAALDVPSFDPNAKEYLTKPLADQHAALLAAYDIQRKEVARLEALVADQHGTHDGKPGHASDSSAVYPPNPDALARLASVCGVTLDLPPVGSTKVPTYEPDDVEITKMGMRPEELSVLNDAIKRLDQRHRERIRTLYLEATGEPEAARYLSAEAMMTDIQAKGGEQQSILRAISRERAGQATPPANLADTSPEERAMRYLVGLPDELQELLAQSLGADRARELRATGGGFPFGRSTWTSCRSEAPTH